MIFRIRKSRRKRWAARRMWRRIWIPFAVLKLEGSGRALVVFETLETRWSDRNGRRLWRRRHPAPVKAERRAWAFSRDALPCRRGNEGILVAERLTFEETIAPLRLADV